MRKFIATVLLLTALGAAAQTVDMHSLQRTYSRIAEARAQLISQRSTVVAESIGSAYATWPSSVADIDRRIRDLDRDMQLVMDAMRALASR